MSIHTKHSPADCEVCAAQQEADAIGAIPTGGHSDDSPQEAQERNAPGRKQDEK